MKRIVEFITKPQVIKTLYLLMIIMLVCNVIIFAQPPSDPGGGSGSGDPDAPIDGGLSLLIAAGIGYGAKKIKNINQQKNTDILNK